MESTKKQRFQECRAELSRVMEHMPEEDWDTKLHIFAATLNDYLAPYGRRATITIRPLVDYPEKSIVSDTF